MSASKSQKNSNSYKKKSSINPFARILAFILAGLMMLSAVVVVLAYILL